MSSADVDQTPAEGDAPAVDELRQAMLATLQAELGDAVVGHEIKNGDISVRVERSAWRSAAEACKTKLDCDYFCFLSGLDWMPSPYGTGQKEVAAVDVGDGDGDEGDAGDEAATEAEETADTGTAGEQAADGGGWVTGVAGGETRFQVFARLYSTTRKAGITLKADLDDERPRVESWVAVYRGADWHERETWEMLGFEFVGHPNLRHLYLPAEFEGNPLRKDFPLLARMVKPWPGIVDIEPMPEEEGGDAATGDAPEASGGDTEGAG